MLRIVFTPEDEGIGSAQVSFTRHENIMKTKRVNFTEKRFIYEKYNAYLPFLHWLACLPIELLPQEKAEKYYNYLVKFVVDFDDETIKEAMKFRAENKSRNLSYIDCIGYIIAIRNNIKFLTGDEQFKNFPNVEFAK